MLLDEYTGIHSISIEKTKNRYKYYLYKLYFKDLDDNNLMTTKFN